MTAQMLALAPHPDYSACIWDAPSHGDRCICGGVRYWHAVARLGCDDCPCEGFVPDIADVVPAVTLVPSVEELAAYFAPHGDGAIHLAFGWLTSACTRPSTPYTLTDLALLAVNLRKALRENVPTPTTTGASL